jgi:5-hydroxyisourate hydrolase-like protein (transthyretin family)
MINDVKVAEKIERRGRPAEIPAVVLEKFERTFYEFSNEQYQKEGSKSTWFYDKSKFANGPYKVEITYPKGYKHNKFKAEKSRSYNSQPVVMVFKTSERSNAKYKMKIWNNENIDYIISAPTLPGVPDNAIILEVGVGESFINTWVKKYKL